MPDTTTDSKDTVADGGKGEKATPTDSTTENGDGVLVQLKNAAKGLLFPSESDKPVKPFWREGKPASGEKTVEAEAESLSPDTVKTLMKLPEGATVETVSAADFFAPVIEKQDWFGPEEMQTAEKFQTLLDILQKNLTGLSVFRVANADPDDKSLIDVYVIGKTESGNWAGVTTQLVET